MALIFLISFASVAGSLYFSEILNLDPCLYCWYQRIFMYPVAILSTVSIVGKIYLRKIFILFLTIPGMLLAFYQYILQMTMGDSDVSVCGGSVSCTFIDFRTLGFITIPFLSFVAFFLINFILIASYYIERRKYGVEKV